MIGVCSRCNRGRYIYNPKAKIKLCMSCYNMQHRNPNKVRKAIRRWQDNNREHYNEYMRNYMRKRSSKKDAKENHI